MYKTLWCGGRFQLVCLLFGCLAGPAFAQADLSSLVASPDALQGGTVVRCTLHFSTVPTAPTRVLMTSSTSSVAVPPVVVVPAHTPSFSFNANTTVVPSILKAWITAKSGTSLAVAYLTLAPAMSSFTIPYVVAKSGNGAVEILWKGLDPDEFHTTLGGYYVERLDPTTLNWDRISGGVIQANGFVDNSGTPGISYSYRVGLVDSLGHELSTSPVVTGTASAGNGLSWVSGPAIDASGRLTFTARRTDGSPAKPCQIVLNGTLYGTATLDDSGGQNSSGYVTASIDTATVPPTSPKYQVQLIDDGGATLLSTPLSLVEGGTLPYSVLDLDGVVDPSLGYFAHFKVTGNQLYTFTPWKASLLDPSGRPVRTWRGLGPYFEFWWDGTDAGGNQMADGTYSLSLTPSSGSPLTIPVYAMIGSGTPNFLVLIRDLYGPNQTFGPDVSLEYASWLDSRLAVIAERHPGYSYRLIYRPAETALSNHMLIKLRQYLSSDALQDVYVYGHGSHVDCWPFFGVKFHSYYATDSSNVLLDSYVPGEFSIPYLLSSRSVNLNSVFLDVCNGGGNADDNGQPGLPTYNWLYGWYAGGDVPTFFIGWNGHGITNHFTYGPYSEYTNWYRYRQNYWSAVTSGYYLSRSLSLASTYTDHYDPAPFLFEPWDVYFGNYRLFVATNTTGDTHIPGP